MLENPILSEYNPTYLNNRGKIEGRILGYLVEGGSQQGVLVGCWLLLMLDPSDMMQFKRVTKENET